MSDADEERGVCMNCGGDMDYSPMHPWCPDCDEEDEYEPTAEEWNDAHAAGSGEGTG